MILKIHSDLCYYLPIQAFLNYSLIIYLETLPQYVHNGSVNAFDTPNSFNFLLSGVKIICNDFIKFDQWGEIKIQYAFHVELGTQQVKKYINAIIFKKIEDLIYQFVLHRKSGGGVRETWDHLSKITL